MPRWDLGRFGLQRQCTCKSKSAECYADGWHTVDTFGESGPALYDQRQLAEGQHGAYRVIEVSTGEVVSPAMDFRRIKP